MTQISRARILVVDLRSQLTPVIERTLRENGYRSAVHGPRKAAEWLLAGNETDAIILSGGDFSVYQEGAPEPPKEIFTTLRRDRSRIPILGICYGMQWLAHKLGGTVAAINPEHGNTVVERVRGVPSELFAMSEMSQQVWMNHGDTVIAAPQGFFVTARSRDSGAIAAMEDPNEAYFGVQFHPEATHTQYGPMILRNFLEFAGCKQDWSPSSVVDGIRGELENEAGGSRVAIGFSGGVDSTVGAAIASPVLGDRLVGITIDADHLRLNELAEIDLHAKAAGLTHRVIDLRDKIALFAGITDAETKRKEVFQKGIYVPGMVDEIKRFNAGFFLQGTLAPDLIESGATGAHTIKTHHNVGIDVGVPQLHPLASLFKYEVRALARALGLPESVSERKPFPGPGLPIRVVGKPVTHELLECVRWADHEVEQILRRYGPLWRDEISQLVVAYLGIDTVGQKGEGRVYAGTIGIRAVKTLDYMTAEGIAFEPAIQKEIARVVTKHPLVVRAFFDPTDKPPGTTEFE